MIYASERPSVSAAAILAFRSSISSLTVDIPHI